MRFRSDGTFKIVVFADTQDDESPHSEMIQYIGQALDYEKPDMVVFTGDNVHVSTKSRFEKGAKAIIQPLIDRNIPYAYTFGNHDAEDLAKDYMHGVYMGLGRCLTYNADSSIYGYGNCNIPIYSSDGSNDIAFNLWIIDSNMYPSSGSGYDNVHQDQLDWFARTDAALEAQEGHKVNSLVFQHICLPEIYNCLVESPSGSKSYLGKNYILQLNENAQGYLGEWPCPPNVNSGEFNVLKNRGDVIGVVTGHDHSNSFVGHWQGIDFIQMPGMTFESYGDDNARGYGVIELNENDTTTYKSHAVKYTEYYSYIFSGYSETTDRYYRYPDSGTYISDIKIAQASLKSTAKANLTLSGYTIVDYDLNSGADGNCVYLGYKTTKDYNQAIKDIRFYSGASDFSAGSFSLNINGKACSYSRVSTDLNKGAGGDYIYFCYSKDIYTGPAITGISFGTTTSGSGRVCGALESPDIPADLNKNTSTHNNAVYCFANTSWEEVDIKSLKDKYAQLSNDLGADYSQPVMGEFTTAMNNAKSFIDLMESERITKQSDSYIEGLRDSIIDCGGKLTRFEPEEGLIYGFEKPTLPEELNGKFNSDYASVSYQPTCRYMGTGSTVTLSYDGRQSVYTAVVFGDVNGDSWYDGTDAAIVNCLANGMLTEADVSKAVYAAADCNHDGVIDGLDVELLQQAGVLLADVDQSKNSDELHNTSSVYAEYLSIIDQTVEAETTEITEETAAETPADSIPAEAEEPAQVNGFRMLTEFVETILRFICSIFRF